MKNYISKKPYYIVTKGSRFITSSKIVLGRNVTTDGVVEWFDTEAAYKARLDVVKPKTLTK
jgi:hypothetical protein